MPRVLSGIRPSGAIHIGNYLGALRSWVDLSRRHDALFMIANYHALDSWKSPASFEKAVRDTAKWIVAAGVKPERSPIFIQSDVPEHLELAWIFNSITPIAQLERMTQYKDKKNSEKSIAAAWLNYPLLMAADVLVYKAELVPVGEDQAQHLELTRTIARKFNQKYGRVFPEPKPVHTKIPRLMSLKNPSQKMSKTGDEGIALLDSPAAIKRKITAAPTATRAGQKQMPDSVKNLFTLFKQFAPADVPRFQRKYRSGRLKYAELKAHLGEKIIADLAPIQSHYSQISDHQINEILTRGGDHARRLAQITLAEAKEKIGLV